jgi:hypothetical protein
MSPSAELEPESSGCATPEDLAVVRGMLGVLGVGR